MHHVVPAVLVKSESEFAERFANADLRSVAPLWQLDVLNGSMFGESSFADPQIAAKYLPLPDLELHLMIENPLQVIRGFKKYVPTLKRAIIQAEIDRQKIPVFKKIEELHLETGISLNPETPIEDYQDEIARAQVLLIMGVHSGKSGQTFLGESILKKIQLARSLFPKKIIAVDGGITQQNAKSILAAGANQLCVTSAIWNAPNPRGAFDTLVNIPL